MLVKAPNDAGASLSSDQLTELQKVIHQYTPLQLAWASGYLAAKSEQSVESVEGAQVDIGSQTHAQTLTILYSSQTGNAKSVAEKISQTASEMGIKNNLVNMADYKAKSLQKETHILIVTSTNGEGEPPDDAMALHDYLGSKRAPTLSHLKYSVLALGDSSYEYFCQTGKDFDQRLRALGADALHERIDCDVDYQQDANDWQQATLSYLQTDFKNNQAEVVSISASTGQSLSLYNKEHPFLATVLDNQKITGRDSNKVVQHIELDLTDSGLRYKPGDALGVWPKNSAENVEQLCNALGLSLAEQVQHLGAQVTLEYALSEKLEITRLSKSVVEHWAKYTDNALNELVLDSDALRAYLNSYQLIDLVKAYPAKVCAQELVDLLDSLTPRLYSIASSQKEVEDEVHLTVGLVSYLQDGERRTGCASGFLIEHADIDEKVKIFIEPNAHFSLPDDPAKDIIMIGPGTGIAPFRSFMQEREATGATGKNWLFFGDQTFTQDFLYQVEWQAYLKSGVLTRLDLAFSRDQANKVYVQHKLEAAGEEVFNWLEQGAYLYICGDMSNMAKDVHSALQNIIIKHGNKSLEQAEDYLKNLRLNKRYQKDVY
ncbi:assimilatory sulfite reductase (NADPH) flavoprotein subunit [Thalassotalea aquiviva]|uniref:assimilatory sulfite reductase (NADPH) flavoprotein subunit n=1 Tax=Thalassotalea aquiviva TaxID=3242415 RepID=UPI00352A18C6